MRVKFSVEFKNRGSQEIENKQENEDLEEKDFDEKFDLIVEIYSVGAITSILCLWYFFFFNFYFVLIQKKKKSKVNVNVFKKMGLGAILPTIWEIRATLDYT